MTKNMEAVLGRSLAIRAGLVVKLGPDVYFAELKLKSPFVKHARGGPLETSPAPGRSQKPLKRCLSSII